MIGTRVHATTAALFIANLLLWTDSTAAQSPTETWVVAWATAQQILRGGTPAGGARGPAPAGAAPGNQPAGRGSPPVAGTPPARRFPAILPTVTNQTVRMIARTTIGGSRVRVRLANAFGAPPVTIGAAHLALRQMSGDIVPVSDRILTFNGQPTTVLAPGAVTVSDPVTLEVPALADVAVSLYLPGDTGAPTSHLFGLHTTYISTTGDQAGRATLDVQATTESYYWLAGVDVSAPPGGGTLVAFGDSLTDGDRSTVDGNHMWPAALAARLRSRRDLPAIGVANVGIAGNQLLQDGALGVNAPARFDRDILGQPGARWVVVLEGINDIGTLSRPPAPGRSPVTVADITGVLTQLAERARLHGLVVIGGTLPPFQGANTYSEEGERVRQAVNAWIRGAAVFAAVIDFDLALRDPTMPQRYKSGLGADDFLHPNDAGYAVMANAIDLSLFTARSDARGRR